MKNGMCKVIKACCLLGYLILATVGLEYQSTHAQSTSQGVTNVAWKPDGSQFAITTVDGVLSIINSTTMRPEITITANKGIVYSLAWHPDGTKIASVGIGGVIHLWDAKTGQLLTEQPTLLNDNHIVPILAWSSDGTLLACLGANTDYASMQVWSITDTQFSELSVPNPNGSYFSMAWSPTTDSLAIGKNSSIRVLHFDKGNVIQDSYFEVGIFNSGISWSPDESRIAVGDFYGQLTIMDANTGAVTQTWAAHKDTILSVAWSLDGQRLATAGKDRAVRIWNPTTSTLLESQAVNFYPTNLAWSSHGVRLVYGMVNQVVLGTLDLPSGEQNHELATNAAFKVIVPAPSRDQLTALISQCVDDPHERDEFIRLSQTSLLQPFIESINTLATSTQLHVGCASDIIALTVVLPKQ